MKVVTRNGKSRKDRQYNTSMERTKRMNIDLQNTTQKTKDGLYNPAANPDVRICSERIYTLYAGVAGMYILMKSSE